MRPPPTRRSRAALAAAAALLGSGTVGCLAEHALVQYVRPVEVRATGDFEGELRVLRVRAYADEDYRAGDGSWAESIRAQIGRASAILEKDFGVRLEVDSVLPWSRPDRARPLEDAAEELYGLDPARDVDWVVGFVAALPEDSGERAKLGIATPFGRHVVLRSMDSVRHRIAANTWDELDDAEREALVLEWRRHEETAVFLHEWAHTLGAVHECQDRWIMSRRYDLEESAFSPESVRLVRVGLAHRERRDADVARDWRAAYRLEASRMTGAAWDCKAMEDGLADAQAFLAAAASRAGPDPVRSALRTRDAARRSGGAASPDRLAPEAVGAPAPPPRAPRPL